MVCKKCLPQPSAAVLLSPWADLSLSGESMTTKAGVDPALTRHALATRAADYAAGVSYADPLVSPHFCGPGGTAPALDPSRVERGPSRRRHTTCDPSGPRRRLDNTRNHSGRSPRISRVRGPPRRGRFGPHFGRDIPQTQLEWRIKKDVRSPHYRCRYRYWKLTAQALSGTRNGLFLLERELTSVQSYVDEITSPSARWLAYRRIDRRIP